MYEEPRAPLGLNAMTMAALGLLSGLVVGGYYFFKGLTTLDFIHTIVTGMGIGTFVGAIYWVFGAVRSLKPASSDDGIWVILWALGGFGFTIYLAFSGSSEISRNLIAQHQHDLSITEVDFKFFITKRFWFVEILGVSGPLGYSWVVEGITYEPEAFRLNRQVAGRILMLLGLVLSAAGSCYIFNKFGELAFYYSWAFAPFLAALLIKVTGNKII